MNIGIIRDTFFTNEPRGLNIARKLLTANMKIHVLCYGQSSGIENHEGITIDRFHLKNRWKSLLRPIMNTIPIYSWLWEQKIRQFIIKYQIDVLQVHDLYMLGPAIKVNKKFNLPIVTNFHENYPAAVLTYNWANSLKGKILFRPKLWKKLQGKYLRREKKNIVTCEEYKENLLKLYDYLEEKDILVYLNVPDLEEFNTYKISPDIMEKKDDFILLYFGVNAERRGLFTALDALKILVKQYSNIKLLLIGPIDKADISRFNTYLDDPVLSNHIIFHKWKEMNEIPSYITKSDICLSPLLDNEHHNTTIANKLFQYMLFEKPMVISDCKPQERLIKETNAGVLHKADSTKSLTEKIMELYKDPVKRRDMGKKGKYHVLQQFNTQVQSQKIVKMYKEMQKNLNLNSQIQEKS